MNGERPARPFADAEHQELGNGGGVPHLSDYWQVITRRIWLVLLIFAVTTASAMWAVSQQKVYYRATLALQINDPLQRSQQLTPGARISGMDVFVDPIQSEMELLRSSSIAVPVVDSLGLRLMSASSDLNRSSLLRNVWVASEAPTGLYRLVYDDTGTAVRFEDRSGQILGAGPVGEAMDVGFARFTPRPPPRESRSYELNLVPLEGAVPQVRNNLSATARQNTNIIDVSFTHSDPVLAPEILNAVAQSLRDRGAQDVRVAAGRQVQFIEERLDSAQTQLSQSLAAIRDFKETQDFTNLSAQEQRLVNQSQELVNRIESLESQRSILAGLVRSIQRQGLTEEDLVALTAELPPETNPQIANLVDRIDERREELNRILNVERKTEDHPQARAARDQLRDLERDLAQAVEANLRVIEDRLETLNQQLTENRQRQRSFPALENQLQTLELRQNLDQNTYEYLLSQLYQSRITEAAASPYVDVIDPATGATPIQPRGRINIVLGALLGLILGVGAAFFLEYLDRTVRTSSDVETLLGIPVLGVIPRLLRVDEEDQEKPLRRPPSGVPLVVALDPLDPAAEAYRNLRMNLMFMSTEDDPIRSILVSSPGPAEGKSTTAVNMAVMLAQQGQRVLLVDADLRRPALHRALDLLREPGLSNVLVGDADVREAVRPSVLPNLDMLPSGPFPPNPSELLNSKTMQRLLEEFEAKYSHVVIDSPPILAVTDAALLASHTDGILIVLRSGETEQKAAERSVDQLQRLGVRVFGAVLNEVASTTTEESYYLQYYYSYEPDSPSGWDRLRQGVTKARFW